MTGAAFAPAREPAAGSTLSARLLTRKQASGWASCMSTMAWDTWVLPGETIHGGFDGEHGRCTPAVRPFVRAVQIGR